MSVLDREALLREAEGRGDVQENPGDPVRQNVCPGGRHLREGDRQNLQEFEVAKRREVEVREVRFPQQESGRVHRYTVGCWTRPDTSGVPGAR